MHHPCGSCVTGFRVVVAHPHLELIDEEGRERGDFLAHSWQCTTLSVAWPRSCAPTAVSHSPGGGVGLPEQNNAIRDSDHVLELFSGANRRLRWDGASCPPGTYAPPPFTHLTF